MMALLQASPQSTRDVDMVSRSNEPKSVNSNIIQNNYQHGNSSPSNGCSPTRCEYNPNQFPNRCQNQDGNSTTLHAYRESLNSIFSKLQQVPLLFNNAAENRMREDNNQLVLNNRYEPKKKFDVGTTQNFRITESNFIVQQQNKECTNLRKRANVFSSAALSDVCVLRPLPMRKRVSTAMSSAVSVWTQGN